jgi:death-on-curing protein
VTRYLSLDQYMALAAMVLDDIDERSLLNASRPNLADSALHAPAAGFGDVDLYPDLATKAGVLGYRLVKNHPLPDGNKRTAFVAIIEFLHLNGRGWNYSGADTDDIVKTMLGVADGSMTEGAFIAWVEDHIL